MDPINSNNKEIFTAFLKFQRSLDSVCKNKKAGKGTYSYEYADLASVLDEVLFHLHENGFALTQNVIIGADGCTCSLVTRILHDSGDKMELGDYPVICENPKDPQKLGAAITYARRHSLTSAFGIRVDDYDANDKAEVEDSGASKKGICKGCGKSSVNTKTGVAYDYCFNCKTVKDNSLDHKEKKKTLEDFKEEIGKMGLEDLEKDGKFFLGKAKEVLSESEFKELRGIAVKMHEFLKSSSE